MDHTGTILINNRWITTADVRTVCNPYNGEALGRVCLASDRETDSAIEAACSAAPGMRRMSGYERSRLLRRTAQAIDDQAEDFAGTIAREAGKPVTAARGEVTRAVTTFSLAAEEASRAGGEVIPLDIAPGAADRIAMVRRFPLGPVLAITPFNFPLNLAAHKIAPALAAGNTVVHKPSSRTPLTAIKLGEALVAAGMPAGAVNVLPCEGSRAEKMAADSRLKMVSFTGSPDVGWHLKASCGKKKISLELGGNAAAVIEPDADIDFAVSRCVFGGYAYAGQVCIALQRIYVHEDLYAAFEEKFTDAVKRVKTGDPLNGETLVGPLISDDEVRRVAHWVAEAQELGGRLLAGGSAEGSVYRPTVLADVPARALCVRREVFGPVTVLFRYRTFDEAVERVNDSPYGLQAGIFTASVDSIFTAFNRLDVGGVIINDVPTYRSDNYPYGGVKDSGFGREGVRFAMEEMTEMKTLVLDNKA